MDELRESSLLFSLESLLETERERVQREAREAQKRREEELKRVAELAERRRVAGQQEREARQRRMALEQERERLEQERIEAMKHATVQQARIEAESRMRLVEVEQQRKHDLALAKIHDAERTTHYRMLTWLSGGILAAVVAAGAFGYLGLVQPAHASQQERLQALLTSADHKRALSERELVAERSKNRELTARVELLEAELAKPAPKPKQTSSSPSKLGKKGGSPPPPPTEVCKDDGDPLNKALCVARRR
jgi:colicin import membrane protein